MVGACSADTLDIRETFCLIVVITLVLIKEAMRRKSYLMSE